MESEIVKQCDIHKERLIEGEYNRGFNDALIDISLVNLEFKLNNDPKTMGELAAICRERRGIPKGNGQ